MILLIKKIFESIQTVHATWYARNFLYEYKKTNSFLWIFANVITRFCEHFLVILSYIKNIFNIAPKGVTPNSNIIVSLTSFPKRIGTLWMVIDSLLNQELAAVEVRLYLSKKDFPYEITSIPAKLLRYLNYGLKIIFVEDNLMPHKKYIYSFMEETDNCIITVDDDSFYRPDLLSRLWEMHLKHPGCICANNARKIALDSSSKVLSYKNWKETHKTSAGHDICAIGFGGVLYPPSFYNRNSLVTDMNKIKSLCLQTDDLWLKANEIISNIAVVTSDYYAAPATIPSTKSSALQLKNRSNLNNRNDENWNKIADFFDLHKL